ncbi:MAG: magnesium/cobalt transporter CorA [Dehalococcoidia bacterium]
MTTDYHNGVRALLCTEGGIEYSSLNPDQIDQFIAAGTNLLWLDIDTAVTRDLSLLRREFGFHELALEDALRHQQRSKIDAYDGYSFLIFYSVAVRRHHTAARGMPGEAGSVSPRNLLRLHQISIFVGSNYLVTLHHGSLPAIDEIAARWHSNLEKVERSIASLLYSLLDTIVDEYFPVIDHIAEIVETVEERVFEKFDEGALEEIFSLKKSLLAMRRVVAPERDVINVFIRRDIPLLGSDSVVYFQDVYDHLVRVTDSIDIYRDLLSSALDAYLSMASNRLNQVMKTLTSWTIPLMAGALLAGIWGMNFDHMPELHWRFGYLFALIAITLTIVIIAGFFKRKRWL